MATFVIAAAATAAGQDFTIDWYTIDGGGEMFTTGGNFELSGTIGQPDAGVVMTGGNFELVGGFWPGAGASSPCDPCDMDCDGNVNAFDIEPFLGILFGGDPRCDSCTGDVNDDGVVDAFDIEPFLNCLFP
jgi:hypothetical protein